LGAGPTAQRTWRPTETLHKRDNRITNTQKSAYRDKQDSWDTYNKAMRGHDG